MSADADAVYRLYHSIPMSTFVRGIQLVMEVLQLNELGDTESIVMNSVWVLI